MKLKKHFDNETINEALAIDMRRAKVTNREKVDGFTIDGETSKDLDDGFNVFSFDTHHILQISIADVAEYVKPSSHLFREAMERVNTKYLASHNLPMLPHPLSENKLSLLEGKQTPTITVEMKFKLSLELQELRIFESVFLNKKRFSYSEISKYIKKQNCPHEQIMQAHILAMGLLNKRIDNNELVVYNLINNLYSDEEGNMQKTDGDRASEGNVIIQEFMIITNKLVSEYLAKNDVPIIFRNHTSRSSAPERDELIDILKESGTNQYLFDQLAGKTVLWFNKAFYSPSLQGHFALNATSYMHFTSPIRRFADLINHYQIKAHIHNTAFFTKGELNSISMHINKSILDFEEQKTNVFKVRAIKEAQIKMSVASPERLMGTDANSFKMILKLAFAQDIVAEELTEVIKYKIENNGLNIRHVYMILFDRKNNEANWAGIKDLINEHLRTTMGYANQLLNILISKKSPIRSISPETKEENMQFYVRMVAVIGTRVLSTPEYHGGTTKKEAQDNASVHFLFAYLNSSLVDANKTTKPKKENLQIPDYNNNGKNHLSEINNLYLVDSAWSKPEYKLELLGGSPNNPVFGCTITMECKGVVFRHTAKAASKKTAKVQAANNMHDEIITQNLVLLQ